MSDWTATERIIKTPNGNIRYGGPCRDDYKNFETYDQGGGHAIIVLQRPAMIALLAAQVRYAKRTGWTKDRIERNTIDLGHGLVVPEGRAIICTPGTFRSCSTQTSLYRGDSSRYAAPQITGHPRGLAIDRSTSQPNLTIIDQSLALEGWNRTRPTEEPWHWSYFVTI